MTTTRVLSRHIPWKLIFKYPETHPGLKYTCTNELTHPFKGLFFMFHNAENFAISSVRIGPQEQLAPVDSIPCAVLQAQNLEIQVGLRATMCSIEITNISNQASEIDRRVMPFYCELHGRLLIGDGEEEPKPTEWQARSILK